MKVLNIFFRILLMALFFLVFMFSVPEIRREYLLRKYEATLEVKQQFFSVRQGKIKSLLKRGETHICALDSYGRIQDLKDINQEQMASVPKSMLPSQDGSWYLLYFSKDHISRIFLIDANEVKIIVEEGRAGCIDENGRFKVLANASRLEENHLVFKISSNNILE